MFEMSSKQKDFIWDCYDSTESNNTSWENIVRSGIRTHAHIRGPERSIPDYSGRF